MRVKNKLVYGVGVNDLAETTWVDGKPLPFYNTWKNMLCRCYSAKNRQKYPTYVECSVCNEWLLLSNFKKWYDLNYIEGFHMDKDILLAGNKVYCPEFCRFVPVYLNSLLTDSRNAKGNLPTGITADKPNTKNRKVNLTYIAYCSDGHGKRLGKTFKTVEESQEWYRVTKTRVVKEQAQRAFLENAIKSDVYLALVRRKF